MAAKKIKWELIQVRAGDLKSNPHNPKKRDEAGYNRLKKVTEKFGFVFHGIINKDLTIIDGHTRNELTDPDEKVSVFAPSRQLTDKEYKEMNAIYDIAKAGIPDLQIIEQFVSEEIFEEYEIEKDKKQTVSFEVKPKPVKPKWPIVISCRSEEHRKKVMDQLKKLKITFKID